MKPVMFMHVFACLIHQLPELINDKDGTKGLINKPDSDGFYYEFSNDENFKIIKHTQEQPYEAVDGMDYAGPISPEKFMELCLSDMMPFLGIASECPLQVHVNPMSQEVLVQMAKNMGMNLDEMHVMNPGQVVH